MGNIIDNLYLLNKIKELESGTGSGEYAPTLHTHTKSQITDFPTKLSQFTNDLPTSSGGTGATKTSALITDFGAVNNNSVTYNTSTKTYVGTDCSQAILDAIASGYTKIEFPSGGNFIVNTTIPVNKKVLIEGNGANIYINPIKGQDHNVFYFKDGSDYSVIRGLNFYSTNAYTVNLNTNVTALSSNNCAIGINNNAENIIVSDCYAEGFKYVVACSVCRNVIIDYCRGKENYFSIYTGFNAYNTYISRCNFAEQTETDIYGHVLYLGGATYGVEVNNCYFEALGDDSSNIIKCGADQTEYCTGVVVKNTTMKCKSKASFLYCHAHADVQYENCRMIFTNSDSSAYPRLLQFNPYSNMRFKDCYFELDSVQRFTHVENSYNENSLIFEDCSFLIKNTVNKYLTFNLVAGSKIFRMIRCTMDYSLLDRAINLLNLSLYSLEFIDGTLYLPYGSVIGQMNSSAVSYTQTQSPRLLMTNTTIIRTYNDTDSSMFLYYVKGSSSALVSLANVTIINGQSNTGANSGKYQIDTANNEYNALHNVVNISDSGVTSSIVGGDIPSGGGSGSGSSSSGTTTVGTDVLLAELGSIDGSGTLFDSTTRARTNYLAFNMGDTATLEVPTGYYVAIRFYDADKNILTPSTMHTTSGSYWGISPDTSFDNGWISNDCTVTKAENASGEVAFVRFVFKHGTDDSSLNIDTLKGLSLVLNGTTYKLDGSK